MIIYYEEKDKTKKVDCTMLSRDKTRRWFALINARSSTKNVRLVPAPKKAQPEES